MESIAQSVGDLALRFGEGIDGQKAIMVFCCFYRRADLLACPFLLQGLTPKMARFYITQTPLERTWNLTPRPLEPGPKLP